MKVALGCCLILPALLGCGGSSGHSMAGGADPEAIRNSPAGIASLAFLDLERLGPDLLATGAGLPGCIAAAQAGGATTYTFQCPAAGSGSLTGTVTATPDPKVPGGITLAYDLTVAAGATVPSGALPLWTWTYRGQAAVVVSGSTATVTVIRPTRPGASLSGLKLVYADNLDPSLGKTCDFSASLAASWTVNPRRLMLQGSYAVDQEGAQVIACSIAGADPLIWSSCGFPVAGTLELDLLPAAGVPEQAQAGFPGCGSMTLAGDRFQLGE